MEGHELTPLAEQEVPLADPQPQLRAGARRVAGGEVSRRSGCCFLQIPALYTLKFSSAEKRNYQKFIVERNLIGLQVASFCVY